MEDFLSAFRERASKKILVTGAAGFIGAFLCRRLLEIGDVYVVGLDNMNDYYDVNLKVQRLSMLAETVGTRIDMANCQEFSAGNFSFVRGDIADENEVMHLFANNDFDIVINLAAQAGVRYSIDNPRTYITSNIVGFFNILEACRHYSVSHLVYASSSSVYGSNNKVPYSESDRVDAPVSLYAATKKSNELMAYAYSKLYEIPATGLRFFTVYGPMGRPDMAYFKFAEKLVRGESIQVYNYGKMYRDFTYIDDIVTGILAVIDSVPTIGVDGARHKVYNIGNNSPISLLEFIEVLERALVAEHLITSSGKHELLPMQPGDVYQTYADTNALECDFGFKPSTRLEDGLKEFTKWYAGYLYKQEAD